MHPLAIKKASDDVLIKLGSDKDKKKEVAEKEEKAKKASMSINAFLKALVRGEFNNLPLRKVGTMFNGAVYVYAAEQIDNENAVPDFVFFALVLTTDLRSYNRIQIEYTKSSLVGETHPNILPVVACEYLSNYACHAIKKVDDSIRSLITAVSENGIGRYDWFIPIVLKEVLKGLCFIHDQGLHHGNLNLGYVYLTGEYENAEIKLGFAASTFEPESAGPAAHYLPKEWTDEKSDIWMLGLVGLELAYGVLSFTEEEHLHALLKKINKTRKLPSRAIMRDYQRAGGLSFFSKIRSRFDYRTDVDNRICDLLASCFEQDPRNRPTAHELLQHEAFKRCKSTDVEEFWTCLTAEGIRLRCLKENEQSHRIATTSRLNA